MVLGPPGESQTQTGRSNPGGLSLLLKPLLQDAAMIFALLPAAGIDPQRNFPYNKLGV